ncbi:glycosyltransferase family 4 protein [Pseudorhodoplanes sp.]|uniref:glycosyltransferase family 4 protein n=1 Tax=Pseudorhodoplanes sp. TaxID=1934341 RepID=UPI002C247B7F|nr:glycosyltransferase family 4 protein [Pseudorhodoplanes sp.]HWV50956.1 glycosyltransferase family 4 protein [Pseudorhodoplanes sp.]
MDNFGHEMALPSTQNRGVVTPLHPLTVLVVVPTLQAGAAEMGAVDLVRILTAAGHRAIVLSRGGRLEPRIAATGAEFICADVASKNPAIMARNAAMISRIVRNKKCDIIHVHGRAPAWSALVASKLARVPFVTSWYKGFREQNALKRLYNSVMARGDRIIAVSDQLAEMISERYRVPATRIDVVPASVDLALFNPALMSTERLEAMRRIFGVTANDRVILVVGRMLRRKGHHVAVEAARRLKGMGLKDFVFVFVGEDNGNNRYAGEVWDQVLASDLTDVVRLIGPVDDMPAAYATASVVVSAAIQAEGLQRTILEAQAMERPVVASDLGAGPDAVLAPPIVPEDRMTGLRFSAGDAGALAAALIRLFSMPAAQQTAMGLRGRHWVIDHFNQPAVSDLTLRLYAGLIRGKNSI